MSTHQNKYYVYGHYLTDTNKLFYIGKGKGNRGWSLADSLISARRNYNWRWREATLNNSWHCKIIRDGMTEEYALSYEAYLIAVFGRLIDGSGFLTNICKGGIGGSHGKNFKWIHKNGLEKRVEKLDIINWQSDGWSLGRSDETRMKNSKSKIGKPSPRKGIKSNIPSPRKGTKNLKSSIKQSHPVECYIIKDGKEILIDKFYGSHDAQNKTLINHNTILSSCRCNCSAGKYNIKTYEFLNLNTGSLLVFPNDKYPNLYKLYWRKIK